MADSSAFNGKVAITMRGGSRLGKEVANRFVAAGGSAINAGVHGLVRNLATALAAESIRINAVAPAVVDNPIHNTFLSEEEEVAQTLPTSAGFHSIGRNGQPGGVADALLFLASDRASRIKGHVLSADSGVTAGRR